MVLGSNCVPLPVQICKKNAQNVLSINIEKMCEQFDNGDGWRQENHDLNLEFCHTWPTKLERQSGYHSNFGHRICVSLMSMHTGEKLELVVDNCISHVRLPNAIQQLVLYIAKKTLAREQNKCGLVKKKLCNLQNIVCTQVILI